MKYILSLIIALVAASCSVGIHSTSGGKDDVAHIVFTADKQYDINVQIDNKTYSLKTVKQEQFKAKKNLKKTTENTLSIPTGQHKVVVYVDNTEVYNKQVLVSAGQTKEINL